MASGFIGSEDWITMSAPSVTTLVLPGAWKCATCLMIKTPQTWRNACMWLKRRWVTHDSWALSCVLLLTDIDMVDINCSGLTSQVIQDFVHQQHEYNMIWIHQLYYHMSTATGVKNRSFRVSTSTSQGGLQVSTAEWITPWVRWMPYTKHKPRGLMLPSSAGRHRLQHWLWGCQYGVSCSNETETGEARIHQTCPAQVMIPVSCCWPKAPIAWPLPKTQAAAWSHWVALWMWAPVACAGMWLILVTHRMLWNCCGVWSSRKEAAFLLMSWAMLLEFCPERGWAQ